MELHSSRIVPVNFLGARKPFIIAFLTAAARLTPMGILVRYRRGFGVIELAIAMVILGIVFVMTLKAGVLVDSIRAVMVTYQIQSIQNRILSVEKEYIICAPLMP
jgi:prepilin-type N-terminal cleavage/methylation domain-containing protein